MYVLLLFLSSSRSDSVVVGHLPLRVMLWIDPTHLYDGENGEKEVVRYLAAMA